jgi:hypothetical protein
MTRAQMLTELRNVIDDTIPDYSWTDTRLLAWLSEGQDKFCKDTGFFVDKSTTAICEITLVADQSEYALSDRIIEVLSVEYGTLRLGKLEDRNLTYPAYRELPSNFDFGTTAVPSYYVLDREAQEIKFYPTPSSDGAGETITLRVWRKPVYELSNNDIDGNGTDASPELASEYQFACIEWAAYKAFMDHDAERQDKVKAGDHKAAYKEYVADGKKTVRRLSGKAADAVGHPLYVVRG